MVNSRLAPRTTILMNGEHLEEVTSFKYLRSIIYSEGDSIEEIRTRINLTTSAIARLNKDKTQQRQDSTKIRLNKDKTLQKHGCVCADIRMRKLDPESQVRKNSRISDDIFQKDPENVLQRPHNKYISNSNHHRKRRTKINAFVHSNIPKTPMIRSYNQTQHTSQRNIARHGQMRKKTRKTQTIYMNSIH